MPHTRDPSRLSAIFAAGAQKEFGALKAALKQAESSMAKLRSGLHVATIKPPRGRIAGSRSSPSLLLTAGAASLGGILSHEISGGLLDDVFGSSNTGNSSGGNSGGSFQQSATQFAAKLFDASLRGQRIR